MQMKQILKALRGEVAKRKAGVEDEGIYPAEPCCRRREEIHMGFAQTAAVN